MIEDDDPEMVALRCRNVEGLCQNSLSASEWRQAALDMRLWRDIEHNRLCWMRAWVVFWWLMCGAAFALGYYYAKGVL